jgi:hypothetical protein
VRSPERAIASSTAFVDAQIGIDAKRHFRRNRHMMKTRIAVMALAVSFMTAGACFAANPHLGTWKLNEAKSTTTPETGKNNTVVYTEMKDKIKVTVDGVDKDGKPRHGVWEGKTDGKAYKTKGNMPWDSMAYKVVNDHTYELTAMKGGKVFSTGKSTVSADGKSRTVTMNGTTDDGKKFKNKTVYDKK